MDSIFEVKNLEVIRSGETILKVDELKIDENDKVGIIGANGAGKTTFEKVLLNRIEYNGKVTRNTINKNIGVHLQENALNKFLKVKELIEICSSQKLNEVMKNEYYISLNIGEIKNRKIEDLSGGEKQKLILFLIFYKQPDILFFDEPTTGLDYESRIDIISNIRDLTSNKTLIMISHYFNEIETLANKVLIIDKGEVIYYGSIKKLILAFSKLKIYTISGVEKESYKGKGLIVKGGLREYLISNKEFDLPEEKINLEIAYKLLLLKRRKDD